MERTLTLLIGAVAVTGLSLAGAAVASHGAGFGIDDPWTAEGTIVVGSPALTPTAPCDENSGTGTGNGVFGDVYELPEPGQDGTGDEDHWFHFEVTDLAGADLQWYQEGVDCESLGTEPSGQTTLCCHTLGDRADQNAVTYTGLVPLGATHVVVNHGGIWPGGSGTYTLTIPVPSPGTCDQSPFC